MCGCNPGIIDVPQLSVTIASSYFFPRSTNAIASFTFQELDTATGAVKNTIRCSIQPFDSLGKNYLLVEHNGTYTDSLSGSASSAEVSLSGLSQHSFIPLPDGYSVTGGERTISLTYTLPLEHIIAKGTTILASGKTGLFVSTDAGKNWVTVTAATNGFDGTVSAFAVMGDLFYAGTSSGLVYESGNGISWKSVSARLSGGVTALSGSAELHTLYIATSSGTVYEFLQNKQSVVQLPASEMTPVFSSLAFSIISTKQQYVLVGGTRDSGLFYYLLSDSIWRPVDSGKFIPISITSLVSTPHNLIFAGTSSGVLFSQDGMTWSLYDQSKVNARLTYDSYSQYVIATDAKGVTDELKDTSVGVKTITYLGALASGSVSEITASSSNLYAATDLGVFITKSGTKSWQLSTSSPTAIKDSNVAAAGAITLLHSEPIATPDSSWSAGQVLKYGQKLPFTLTAKIVGTLNSGVVMPDSTKYPNVIEVQYSFGVAGSTPIPYWQIYYAKDIGPIIIHQLLGSTITRKIYRLK